MKTLKFISPLVKLVLSGEKTTTWRLWDDKNLKMGDEVSLLNSETKQEFAKALLTSIIEKLFSNLNDEDWVGHEKFASDQEMYQSYSQLYRKKVGPNTQVKIISFKLL